MIRVTDFEQLEDMAVVLFVEAICPKCGEVTISTMVDAEKILVFGCVNCADIDSSTLISFNNYYTVANTEEATYSSAER